MKILKQSLAIGAIVLCVVGLLVSMAGMAGIWVTNDALDSETVQGMFDKIELSLTALDIAFERVIIALEQSRAAILIIDQAASQAGDKIESSSPIVNVVSATIGDELYPMIITIRDTISGIRSTVIAVNTSIEAANAIPLVSIPSLPMGKLAVVDEQASNALSEVLALRTEIAAIKTGASEILVSSVTTRTSKVDDDLVALEMFAKSYQDDLNRVSAGLAVVKPKIMGFIDLASVLLTALLLWFALGQISLAVFSWEYYKKQ